MTIEFDDGMKFDTSGDLHVEARSDGYYVVGKGMLIPVNSAEDGNEMIARLNQRKR